MGETNPLEDVERAAERMRAVEVELESERAGLPAAIPRAASVGVPAARIARAAGVSRERVRQVLAEGDVEPPAKRLPHPRREGNGA
ncbi:MAG: hypothetical protein R6W48_11345 [Gaiellaceae bacterium]